MQADPLLSITSRDIPARDGLCNTFPCLAPRNEPPAIHPRTDFVIPVIAQRPFEHCIHPAGYGRLSKPSLFLLQIQALIPPGPTTGFAASVRSKGRGGAWSISGLIMKVRRKNVLVVRRFRRSQGRVKRESGCCTSHPLSSSGV